MNMDDVNYINNLDVRIMNANNNRDYNTSQLLENTRNSYIVKRGFNPRDFPVGCYFQNQPPPVYSQQQPNYGVYQPQPMPNPQGLSNGNHGFIQPTMDAGMGMGLNSNNNTMMGNNASTKTIDCLYPDGNNNNQNNDVNNNRDEKIINVDILPLNKIPYGYATAVGVTPDIKVNGGYYETEFNGKAAIDMYNHKVEDVTIESDNDYIKQYLDILTYSTGGRNKSNNMIYRINTHKKYLCISGNNSNDEVVTGYDNIMRWCGSKDNPLVAIIASIMTKEHHNTIKYRTMYNDQEFKSVTNPEEFIKSLKDGTFTKKTSSSSDKKYMQTAINLFDKFFSSSEIVKAGDQLKNMELKGIEKDLYEFKIPVTKYFIYTEQIINDFKDGDGGTVCTVAINEFSHEIIYNLLKGNESRDSLFTYLIIDTITYRVLKYNDTFILNQEV